MTSLIFYAIRSSPEKEGLFVRQNGSQSAKKSRDDGGSYGHVGIHTSRHLLNSWCLFGESGKEILFPWLVNLLLVSVPLKCLESS
jgi:hypothetical protein